MDCEGWTAFKIKYKEELQQSRASESNELVTKQIMDYLQMYAQDGEKQDQLDKVVDLIYHARRIIFIGAGPSGILAKYAAL